MYEEYEYKSLRERMESYEDDFLEALLDSPLFNNGHNNDEKEIDVMDSLTDSYTSTEDILPF